MQRLRVEDSRVSARLASATHVDGAAILAERGDVPLECTILVLHTILFNFDRLPVRSIATDASESRAIPFGFGDRAAVYSPTRAAASPPRRRNEVSEDAIAKIAAARRSTSDTTPIKQRRRVVRAAGAADAESQRVAQRAQLNEILRRAQRFKLEAEGHHDIFKQAHVADFVHALLVEEAPRALQQQMRTELSQRALCADDVEQAIRNAREWQNIAHGVARPSPSGTANPDSDEQEPEARKRLLKAAMRNSIVFHMLAEYMRSAAPDSEEVLLTIALPQESGQEEKPTCPPEPTTAKTAKKKEKKKKQMPTKMPTTTQSKQTFTACTASVGDAWSFQVWGGVAATLLVCVSSLIIFATFGSSLVATGPIEAMTSRCTAAAGAAWPQNNSATTFVTTVTRSTLASRSLRIGSPTSRADDFVGGLGASSGAIKKDGAPLCSITSGVLSSDTVTAWASSFPVYFDALERTRAIFAFEEVRCTATFPPSSE